MIKVKGCAEINVMKYNVLHFLKLSKAILRSGATWMYGHKDLIVLGKDLLYRQPRRTKRIMKKEERRPHAPAKEAHLSSPNRQRFFLTIFHGRSFQSCTPAEPEVDLRTA